MPSYRYPATTIGSTVVAMGLGMELTEADIADDVPNSSRQLSSWLRRTRQNKIRKAWQRR